MVQRPRKDLLGRFFALPKRASKMTSKKHRKKCENQGFWPPKTLPKSFQNTSEIDVLKNMRFLRTFSTTSFKTTRLETLKISIFPRENHYFQGFRKNRFVAISMLSRSKKPIKNPSKTRSEPFKNRCRKRIVFQHRFFRVSALILEGLGPPRWSQVGPKGPAKLLGQPFLTLLT